MPLRHEIDCDSCGGCDVFTLENECISNKDNLRFKCKATGKQVSHCVEAYGSVERIPDGGTVARLIKIN